MMDFDRTAHYKSLISGTDLRGRSRREGEETGDLTADDAASAAYAFATMARERAMPEDGTLLRIAVGRDSRLTGPSLYQGVVRGLAAANCEILSCGLATTPMMFFATGAPLCAHGSVMITASHLPADRNGLKFFLPEGGLSSAQLRTLVEAMRPLDSLSNPPLVRAEEELREAYLRSLAAIAGRLEGLRLVVDASNGSGGMFAGLLASAGADVRGMNLEPDGTFPAHAPNPENPLAMELLSQSVKREGADLGVIFDADCDRAALVDEGGEFVNRDRLIALVAAFLLRDHPGCTIVTDSVTSSGLTQFIAERGGTHRRFKRGYRNVIDEAKRLEAEGVNCPCAIETSGHCALRENSYLDDGAYLVAWLLGRIAAERKEGRDWTQLLSGLRAPAEDVEIRIPLTGAEFARDAQSALAAVERAAAAAALRLAQDSFEGVRVHCPEGGWFMIRKSVHDPVLPVNIQADDAGGARPMAGRLLAMLSPMEGNMDLGDLRRFAEGE